MGPCNKIYVGLRSQTSLGVIDLPDNLGLACNYINSAVALGTNMVNLHLTHPSQTISKFSASVSQASLRQPWNIIFQFWMRLYKTSLMFCTVVHCTACLFAYQVWHLGYDIWNESFNQPLIAQHSVMLILGVMTFAEMVYFVWTVNEKRDISSSPTTKWQRTANVRLASIILTPLAWHHVIATYYPPNSWRPWLCVLFGAVFHFLKTTHWGK